MGPRRGQSPQYPVPLSTRSEPGVPWRDMTSPTALLPREIATARLRLRPPCVDDAEIAFARWTADPEVARYMSWRRHESVADTRAWLAAVVSAWTHGGGHIAWIIELAEHTGPIGAVGLTLDGHRVSVGYALARDYWRQGLATEAAAAVVAVAVDLPGVHRVWAYCDVDNAASARVMEKAGMVFEGKLRRWAVHPNVSELPRDVLVYVAPERRWRRS